jgi:hypothetical protein
MKEGENDDRMDTLRAGKAIRKKEGNEINIRKKILSVIVRHLGAMALWRQGFVKTW